jgi:hypothetical protein
MRVEPPTKTPPGSGYPFLKQVDGTYNADTPDELASLFWEDGIFCHTLGLTPTTVDDLTHVFEAIHGLVIAWPWVREEVGELPPLAQWPRGAWLEVGLMGVGRGPESSGYGRTLMTEEWRGFWFNSKQSVLRANSSVAVTPFEAAVHEFGHLTMARQGAWATIATLAQRIFGDRPGSWVSLYATESLEEFWAELTAASNTSGGWDRIPTDQARTRIRSFVEAIHEEVDVPLL